MSHRLNKKRLINSVQKTVAFSIELLNVFNTLRSWALTIQKTKVISKSPWFENIVESNLDKAKFLVFTFFFLAIKHHT